MADCFTDDWHAYVTNYTPSLHIGSGTEAADVVTLRTAALNHIWRTPALPSAAPNTVTPGTSMAAVLTRLPNFASADLLVFNMGESTTADAYLIHPTVSRNKLIVVHTGHQPNGFDTYGIGKIIRYLLASGCTVIAIEMQGYGGNNNGVTHANLATLESGTFCGFETLLEPIHRALTYTISEHGPFTLVGMTGISGGGWTTTLCAALDERIEVGIEIAGSIPMPLRDVGASGCDDPSGDWEQGADGDHGPFYTDITYEDLYVMACSSGRRFVQALNRLDDTIGYGTGWKKYAENASSIVPTRAAALGGSFEVYQYEFSGHHLVSNGLIPRIMEELSIGLL